MRVNKTIEANTYSQLPFTHHPVHLFPKSRTDSWLCVEDTGPNKNDSNLMVVDTNLSVRPDEFNDFEESRVVSVKTNQRSSARALHYSGQVHLSIFSSMLLPDSEEQSISISDLMIVDSIVSIRSDKSDQITLSRGVSVKTSSRCSTRTSLKIERVQSSLISSKSLPDKRMSSFEQRKLLKQQQEEAKRAKKAERTARLRDKGPPHEAEDAALARRGGRRKPKVETRHILSKVEKIALAMSNEPWFGDSSVYAFKSGRYAVDQFGVVRPFYELKRVKAFLHKVPLIQAIELNWSYYRGGTVNQKLPATDKLLQAFDNTRKLHCKVPKLMQITVSSFRGYKQSKRHAVNVSLFTLLSIESDQNDRHLWMASVLYQLATNNSRDIRSMIVNNLIFLLSSGCCFNRELPTGKIDKTGNKCTFAPIQVLAILSDVPDILMKMRKAHLQRQRERGSAHKSSSKSKKKIRSTEYRAYPINETTYAKFMVAFTGMEVNSGAGHKIRRMKRSPCDKYMQWEVDDDPEEFPKIQQAPIAVAQVF